MGLQLHFRSNLSRLGLCICKLTYEPPGETPSFWIFKMSFVMKSTEKDQTPNSVV